MEPALSGCVSFQSQLPKWLSLLDHLKSPSLGGGTIKPSSKFHKDGKLLQTMSRVDKINSNRKIKLFIVLKNTGELESFKDFICFF